MTAKNDEPIASETPPKPDHIYEEFVSRSDISEIQGRKTEGAFMWKNQWHHAMYFIAYTCTWGMFASYRRGEKLNSEDEVPSWFHILVVYIFFAGPLIYLQVFIGQYTQRGCIMVGTMLPMAYGVGYAMLLNTMFSCSLNIYFCAAILYYTFISMINYPSLSWMLCFPEFGYKDLRCFSKDDIENCKGCNILPPETVCFNPETDIFSASIFKDVVIFGTITPEKALVVSAIFPNMIQALHLILTTIIVISFVIRSLKDLEGSVRICNVFAATAIIISITVLFFNNPRVTFLGEMFRFRLGSLVNITAWTVAIRSTAQRLNLMEGGHFLFGSYMPLTVNCTTRVTYIICIHLSVIFLCNIFGFLLEDFLTCALNLKPSTLNRYSDIDITYALYPTALGMLAAAQLWATLYFLILFSLTLHSTVIQIILIQETLNQEIIKPIYYIYTRVVLVLTVSLIAMVYVSPSGSRLAVEFFLRRQIVIYSLLILIFVVILVYGIENISDDIHFLLHSPPSKYLRWSWIISAVICLCVWVQHVYTYDLNSYSKPFVLIVIIIFSPIPIGMMYQLYKSVHSKDMINLVKPSQAWGPLEKEEKLVRKLFNPRFEVRFRRRRQICKHRCLLNSSTLKKCVEKEIVLLSNVVLEIEKDEEARRLQGKFVEAIRNHKSIMSNALYFDQNPNFFSTERN